MFLVFCRFFVFLTIEVVCIFFTILFSILTVFLSCPFRNLNLIILRKVGKIGGDESKVRARVGHILSCISKDIEFNVTDVKVFYLH